MTMQDLSQILLAAQSPDATARNSAEQQIASLEASDAGGFFQALSAHLSNESNALVERKLAGTSAYTPFGWKSVEIRSAFIRLGTLASVAHTASLLDITQVLS